MGGVPDRTDGVMAEYYSSEDVKDFIRSYRHSTDVVFHMEKHINEIPAADVRPVVRGKWITRPYMMGNTQYCSRCGENYGMKHNFCPNCGADMREES